MEANMTSVCEQGSIAQVGWSCAGAVVMTRSGQLTQGGCVHGAVATRKRRLRSPDNTKRAGYSDGLLAPSGSPFTTQPSKPSPAFRAQGFPFTFTPDFDTHTRASSVYCPLPRDL